MKTTKTTYNSGLNEYRVRFFIDGKYQAGGDYYTDDKEDARVTAERMIAHSGPTSGTGVTASAEQEDYERYQSGELKEEEVIFENEVEPLQVVKAYTSTLLPVLSFIADNFDYEFKVEWLDSDEVACKSLCNVAYLRIVFLCDLTVSDLVKFGEVLEFCRSKIVVADMRASSKQLGGAC